MVGKKTLWNSTSALLLPLFALGACAPHVALPMVLPRSAPTEARLAQYNSLRPAQMTTVITSGSNGATTMWTTATLNNGLSVYYSEDLFPLVGPNSESWRHTTTAQTLESVSAWTMVGTFALAGAGGAFLFAGPGAFRWNGDTAFNVSLALFIPAALSGLTAGISRYVAGWQRRDAFMAFDGDFRSNLGLCLSATGMADCAPPPLPINGSREEVPPPRPPYSAMRTVAPLRF
jgi:hypothetical protein